MNYIIAFVAFLLVVIIYNFYKIKRIIRRRNIKKMKVSDHINGIIEEFKVEANNDFELKRVQNQIRVIAVFKFLFYIAVIVGLFAAPYIYIYNKLWLKEEIPSVGQIFVLTKIFLIIICISFFAILLMDLFSMKKYSKSKELLKKYIYSNFVRKIKPDIKWYEDNNALLKEKKLDLINDYINREEKYKNASFDKIQMDEEDEKNNPLSVLSDSEKVSFEDYMSGIYKEKYNISVSDYKLDMFDNLRYRTMQRIGEGVFGIVKIDKNIKNDIRISNKKTNLFFDEKGYNITTLPDEFNEKFVVFAKEGYKFSETISARTLEIIEDYYDNSKINFDISIRNNEIFFRFKTIDTMELKMGFSIVDKLMLREYANILLFMTELAEEINDNWNIQN